MSKTHPLDLLPGYMSPKEAAEAIGCSVKTLSRRKLPALRHGNIVRYSKATITEFINQCTKVDKLPAEPPCTPSLASKAAKLRRNLPQGAGSEEL